jgi:hypothetical protein
MGLVGWKRMAVVGGRENGGRRKKEEMRKKGVVSHLILMPNRMLLVCVPRNQVYTHTVWKMDT